MTTVTLPSPAAAPTHAPEPVLTRRRYEELDALRGIAAVAVMLFHFDLYVQHHWSEAVWGPLSLGRYGVQLFFIISGFVILLTAQRAASVGAFAWSRFTRLYPAYWTACALIYTLRVLHDPEHAPDPIKALLNLPMIEIAGVPRLENVFWTLQQEVWFYLLIGALIAVRRVHLATWALAAPVAMSLASLRFTRWFGLFLVGVVLFETLKGWKPRHYLLLALVGVDVLSRSLLLRTRDVAGWEYPAGVVVCALLVLAATRRRIAWLTNPVLVFLGGISYSLYLVHATLGSILIERLHGAGWGVGSSLAAAVAASVAVATALTFAVEKPVMRRLRRVTLA